MKVLVAHIWKGAPHVYKPEIELFFGLRDMGVELQFIADRSAPIVQEFINAGFVVHDIDFNKKYEPKKIVALRELLQQEQFDIVHAIYNKSLANIIYAIKGLPIKLIAYRGATINWYDPTNYLTFLNPRINHLICVCNSVEQNVKKNLLFWDTPTSTIYKGQNKEWFTNVNGFDFTELGIPEKAFVVVLASSVRKVKGVEYFVRASKHIPTDLPIHFVLAGQNTNNETLTALKDQSVNRERIHLLGHRDDVLSIVKASDCFVLPTIGIEGLSRSVIEAMLLGTPVISTKCGGPEELITNKETGLLINRKNEEEIATAILSLYENVELRNRLATNAKANIEKHFNVEQNIEKTYTLYEQLMQTK